jgi:L-arabinose isomerase
MRQTDKVGGFAELNLSYRLGQSPLNLLRARDIGTALPGEEMRFTMSLLSPLKQTKRAHVGLYSVGLEAYWEQFPGLRERLLSYGGFIEAKLAAWGEVHNFGLVDTETRAREAGEWFQSRNVDLLLCHAATYATSSVVLPVHQLCPAPAVFLNLQPTARLNYD